MFAMFLQASRFNQPLNSWDVNNVTDMSYFFKTHPLINPLNNWDVSSVTEYKKMFHKTQVI